MKSNACLSGILGVLALFFLMSCDKEEQQQQRKTIIAEAYQQQVDDYKATRAGKCRQEVMDMAKIIVDSTMLARARNIKVVDTLSRPAKPHKPIAPPTKILEDTLEVAPLLPIDSVIGGI